MGVKTSSAKIATQNQPFPLILPYLTKAPTTVANHCDQFKIKNGNKRKNTKKTSKRQTAKKARKTKARVKDMRASQLQIIDARLGVSYHFKRRLLPAVSRLISACREHVHHSKRQSRSLEVIHYKTKAY